MTVRFISSTLPAYSEELDAPKTPEGLIVYTARVSNPANQGNYETGEKLIRYLIKHKHWSPFEMVDMTVEIETSRAIAAQLLRHRSFVFQEFCIAEGSEISCLHPSGKTFRRNIEDLYKLQFDSRWSRLVKVYDETAKELVPAKVKEVFKTGVKPVFRLTLENGKVLEATREHKFLTQQGFIELKELKVGDFVGTNGTPIYQSEDWLKSARAETPKLSLSEIASRAGCTTHTIRKWLKRYGLQYSKKEVAEYTPIWNKGLAAEEQPMFGKTHTSATRAQMLESSRKGPDSNLYVDGKSRQEPFRLKVWRWQAKYKHFVLKRDGGQCKVCHSVESLELDHIEPVSLRPDLAFDLDNLQVLCRPCHRKKDAFVRETVRWSKVQSVEFVGERETYDMEVEHASHNYVANGIVTHNSQRYADVATVGHLFYDARRQDSKNRQASHDDLHKMVKDDFLDMQQEVWAYSYQRYRDALQMGIAKECARFLLPLGTSTRLYMKGSVRSWLHYFEVRCAPETQKEHRDLAEQIKVLFKYEFPTISKALWGEP
jgi:thymidylate synthase (FAD)